MRCADIEKYAQTVATFCNERGGKLKNLSLAQATVDTLAILAEETEWLIAIRLVRENESGQKNALLSLGLNSIE
jgi:hypothetical protein